NIAAAPDLVVRMVYPVEPNRASLGLDYSKNPAQRDAALRARKTGELIVAGPVNLVQGGQGFIGRFPVFIDEIGGGKRFWGLIAVVIDVESLYRESGLLDPGMGLHLAITGRDALGAHGERFFGSADVVRGDPVTVDVMLPSGSWQVAAVP